MIGISLAFTVATAAIIPIDLINPVDVLIELNHAHLVAIKDTKTPPPIASRNLALFHTAIEGAFKTVTSGPRCARSKRAQVNAVVQSSVDTLQVIYPSLDFKPLLVFVAANSQCARTGINIGKRHSQSVLSLRQNDGSGESKPFANHTYPGYWQPTPPSFRAIPLLPNWGNVLPFGVKNVEAYVSPSFADLESEEYEVAYQEVKAIGSTNSTTRTPDQTQIALFWASGVGTYTPPGQWNAIAHELLKTKPKGIAEAITILKNLNVAMADAAIVCWANKYKFNFWRPVTAIHHEGDHTWMPLIETPPFPDYTSGHSTFSGAASEILAHHFGDHSPFTLEYFGITRSYQNLSTALEEAGKSRIYGGIHFEPANRDGKAHGQAVAREILNK
jgi:hypothetical protein